MSTVRKATSTIGRSLARAPLAVLVAAVCASACLGSVWLEQEGGEHGSHVGGATTGGSTTTPSGTETATGTATPSGTAAGASTTSTTSSTPTGTAAPCDYSSDCTGCQMCAANALCSELAEACDADPDCVDLLGCKAACGGTQSCVDWCKSEYPGGTAVYDELGICVMCSCQHDCNVGNCPE